jgi:hypothetical protein
MMPSYYNFDEVVKDGLVKYSGYSINGIDTAGKQAYRHIFDRILNFSSKVFLNKNLKPEMKRKHFSFLIDKFPEYDYLIVNRPDIISKEILTKAMDKSQKKILLLWDSLEKIPIAQEIISMFDSTYSFDIEDCNNYGFHKIENFHFYETPKDKPEIKHDVVFLGTLDDRIDALKNILDYLRKEEKKARAYLYIPSSRSLKKHADIEVLSKIVPFKKSDQYAISSKVILDLGHKNQRGLSFRVFEAMVLQKKLITTNKQIKEYDFYDENNIFIIEDVNNMHIPHSFWNSPYNELPTHVIEKYHIKNWVNKILNGK